MSFFVHMCVDFHLWLGRLGSVKCFLLITHGILQIGTGIKELETAVLPF